MITLTLITIQPIERPRYISEPVTLENFERWFICNHAELLRYWEELEQWSDRPSTTSDFVAWCQVQFDIARLMQ